MDSYSTPPLLLSWSYTNIVFYVFIAIIAVALWYRISDIIRRLK